MSFSYNKITVGGNLTRDIELKFTPDGTAIASGTVAVSEKYKTKSGEDKEETAFIDFVFFGKRAETVAQYFGKGKPILIDGKVKQERWEDKEGNKRSKLVVKAETFTFLPRGAGDGQASGGGASAPSVPPADDSHPDDLPPF